MAKASTMTPEWIALADAVGGVGKLADLLGVARITLHRIGNRGQPPSPELAALAGRLAQHHGLPDPTASAPPQEESPPVLAGDTFILRKLGDGMKRGVFPPTTIDTARRMFTLEQLNALAEADGTDEDILRAVMYLLDETDV